MTAGKKLRSAVVWAACIAVFASPFAGITYLPLSPGNEAPEMGRGVALSEPNLLLGVTLTLVVPVVVLVANRRGWREDSSRAEKTLAGMSAVSLLVGVIAGLLCLLGWQ